MARNSPRAQRTSSLIEALALITGTAMVSSTSGCVLDDWRPPLDACAGPSCASDAATEAGAQSCEGRPALGVACNNSFTCAVRCDGTVWCWGANELGQLGDGTNQPHATPAQVRGITAPATVISAGYNHVCAVAGGAVWCWGGNNEGALGDGTRSSRTTPVAVVGLPARMTSVASGGAHTCALSEDGGVWCWGHNRYGALGDGTTTDTVRAALVPLSERAVQIVTGQYHSCALLESGGAQCWGFNGFGALGSGSTTNSLSPVDVALGDNARSIATLANHGCAALNNGAAQCWGYNVLGGVGDGSQSIRVLPVNVRGLPPRAQSAITGSRHSCALLEGGALHCWGANDRGQLGNGTTVSIGVASSVAVATGASVTRACASDTTTCAALSDGRVRCWGANDVGQIGDGTFEPRSSPTTALLPP